MNLKNIAKIKKKYLKHPPEGFSKKEIQQMTDEEILDMNYFLNEDDPFEELFD